MMQISSREGDLAQAKADVLIVNLFEGVTQPGGGTGAVDAALDGVISREIKGQHFKGKLGETLLISTAGKIGAPYVLVVGLGKSEKLCALNLRRASAAAVRACGK